MVPADVCSVSFVFFHASTRQKCLLNEGKFCVIAELQTGRITKDSFNVQSPPFVKEEPRLMKVTLIAITGVFVIVEVT